MKKQSIHIASTIAIFLVTAAVSHAAPIFSEDFGSISAGTDITTSNTDLTFTRLTANASFTGSLKAQSSSFGAGSSLLLTSSGYGSIPNANGVGVDGLSSSDIWTVSMNIKSSLWTSGSVSYIMMGNSTGTTGTDVYNTNSAVTPGFSTANIGAQSLFALKINGSTGAGGGYLSSLDSAGDATQLTTSPSTVLLNGIGYELHIVANGSAASISVGGDTITAGSMGVYINETLITTATIADSVDATSLRIFANGVSAGNGQLPIEIDNLQLWNSAVAIPEPASSAMLASGMILLITIATRRRVSKV